MKVLNICLRIATIFKPLSFLFMEYFKYHTLFLNTKLFRVCLTHKLFQFVNNTYEKVINNSPQLFITLLLLTVRYLKYQFIYQNIKLLKVLIT